MALQRLICHDLDGISGTDLGHDLDGISMY
jgi:hypothetical protein